MSTTKLRSFVRDAALVVVVFLAAHTWQTRHAVRGTAPAIATTALDGSRVDLSTHRNRPLLVHFFATWCGVCRAEESTIRSLAVDHDVVLVAARSGAHDEVLHYVREHRLEAPVVLDPSGALAHAYGVEAFPTSFVLDEDGSVRFVTVGFTTEIGLRARLAAARAF